MSTTTITKKFFIDAVLTNPTTAKMSDPTGAFGVKRNDNDAVVVADGTAMTQVSTGIYQHTWTDPAYDLTYTAWTEWVYAGETYRFEDQVTGTTAVADGVQSSAQRVGQNLYATPTDLVDFAGLTATTGSGAAAYYNNIASLLSRISREIDRLCRRHFYVETATRYFTPKVSGFMFIDDVLSLTSFGADSDWDDVVDTAWAAAGYKLEPRNKFPKVKVKANPNSSYILSTLEQMIAVGEFGYGNGLTATPFEDLGITGTLAAAGTTSLGLASYANVEAGMTLQMESEQMFVSQVSVAAGVYTATIERGVNGTTAAAHTSVAIKRALYPEGLRQLLLSTASRMWTTRGKGGMKSERIGDYQYTLQNVTEDGSIERKSSFLSRDEEAGLQPYRRLRY